MSETGHQSRRLIPAGAIWVVGALVVLMLAGSTLLVFGQEGAEAFPSATNTKPSGLAAFSEVLKADGYEVVVDRDERPRVSDAGLVIEVHQDREAIDWGGIVSQTDELTPPIETSLESYRENGGRVLLLNLGSEFGKESLAAKSNEVFVGSDKYRVTSADGEAGMLSAETGSTPKLVVLDGLGATNRFLGKEDNAAFYLRLVRGLAPAGSKVVFAEASFGNVQNRTLNDEFGGWAGVAMWQSILALAVGLYGVGRRFGLPVPDRFNERGTSELLTAMGTLLKRGRRYDQALMILLDDAYDRMRKALNAPMGTDAAELAKMAPAPLAESILRIRQNYGGSITGKEWMILSDQLERSLQDFERDAKSRRSLGIKLK